MSIVGLDLSLSSTGVATDGGTWAYTAPSVVDGVSDPLVERCIMLWAAICDDLVDDLVDLAVIEDLPSARLAGAGSSVARLGVLHGVVRADLFSREIDVLLVQPATLKKYATGRGNANKDLVRDAARDRGGLPAGVTSDEADAWWLREIGLALLGDSSSAVTVPKTHRVALDAITNGRTER